MRLPFDRKTAIGYGGSCITETLILIVQVHVASCALGILVSFYGIAMAFGLIIQRKFYIVNENYKTDKNNAHIRDKLFDAIRFHMDSKQLSGISIRFS